MSAFVTNVIIIPVVIVTISVVPVFILYHWAMFGSVRPEIRKLLNDLRGGDWQSNNILYFTKKDREYPRIYEDRVGINEDISVYFNDDEINLLEEITKEKRSKIEKKLLSSLEY